MAISCAGATQGEDAHYTCSNGARPEWFDVTLAGAYRYCDSRGGDFVVVAPFIGVVWIEARRDSCVVYVSDPEGSPREAPCPEGVGTALYGTNWSHVLP